MTARTLIPDYPVPAPVEFPYRPKGSLTCPRCWTTQRATRNLCYHCAVPFRFVRDTPGTDAVETRSPLAPAGEDTPSET